MSEWERVPRSVVRGRLVNSMKRRGGLIDEWRNAPEVVIWRAKPCNQRVLAVWLDPDGWHVAGDRFPVSLDEWARRQGRTREGFKAGEWASFGRPRKIEGISRSQPLDATEWEMGRFEAGCDHGRGWFEMAQVAEDCAKFRACRKAVTRDVRW